MSYQRQRLQESFPKKGLKVNFIIITGIFLKSLQPEKVQMLSLLTLLISFLDLIKLFDA